jgi:hypothetical protein
VPRAARSDMVVCRCRLTVPRHFRPRVAATARDAQRMWAEQARDVGCRARRANIKARRNKLQAERDERQDQPRYPRTGQSLIRTGIEAAPSRVQLRLGSQPKVEQVERLIHLSVTRQAALTRVVTQFEIPAPRSGWGASPIPGREHNRPPTILCAADKSPDWRNCKATATATRSGSLERDVTSEAAFGSDGLSRG